VKTKIVPAEEMTEDMMNAAQRYCDARTLRKSFSFPGLFNWHEFWREILKAAPQGQSTTPVVEQRPPIFPAEWLAPRFDLVAHIHRARAFSEKAFGPIERPHGVIEHIRKELCEIEMNPLDLEEWIDVMILAMDGAWRAGYEPEEIVAALAAKQTKNEARKWPDWRTVPEGAPIEHDRSAE
jgi:hypothetical protein